MAHCWLGIRHHRQEYNLSGANAYLGVLVPLAVLTLIVPRFTQSAPGGNVSPLQAAFLLVTSAGLYIIFLLVQTGSQATYFLSPTTSTQQHEEPPYTTFIHAALLILSMIPVVFLAKNLGKLVDHGIHTLNAPPALGGFLVAILVLSPEGLSARAALVTDFRGQSIFCSAQRQYYWHDGSSCVGHRILLGTDP